MIMRCHSVFTYLYCGGGAGGMGGLVGCGYGKREGPLICTGLGMHFQCSFFRGGVGWVGIYRVTGGIFPVVVII